MSRPHVRPSTGWNIKNVTTHPGEMLNEEFLAPMGISQNKLALDIHVPATRIGQIVKGHRSITPDTALRLAQYFGNSPEFWLNLQQMYDLTRARHDSGAQIEREVAAYITALRPRQPATRPEGIAGIRGKTR